MAQKIPDVVLFSNSKSGGNKGLAVLIAHRAELGADRVFDLGQNPHPERILARDELVAAATSDAGLRVVVCGGDGTMTWIMSAIDAAREKRRLAPAEARYYVAMMPLGTGNDLARTFGWGGAFRAACTKPAWLAAVRGATPAPLDRWLVSVMPSAEGQRKKDALPEVPEVFSIHEFDAHLEAAHRVVKAGRHHSAELSRNSTARLAEHSKDMEQRARTRSAAASVDRRTLDSECFDAEVREEASFGDDGGDRELVGEHVRPSESVLALGGTWRSYDGTFSNYFSVGLDAAGAHAFHAARKADPKRFSSPLKNQALYAWLGTCATGGLCCCKGPPPRLGGVAKMVARVDGRQGWHDVDLPPKCRGVVVLNLRSYAGGRDLWGPPSACRDGCCASARAKALARAAPAHDDGVLEVVTATDVFSMGLTLVSTKGFGGRARRLVRCREVRITTTAGLHMQIDGEPWLQPPATVHLKALGSATVLRRE